ncbi:MAG TPA: M20 family metallopeptidase [Candidatus Kapabacteria bacterium]|nr:M20 family metallopeptidase [Candidatus Kapabacteria bacterium]
MKDLINSKVDEIYTKVLEYRRHIHSNPELSFKEYNTSKYIIQQLNTLDIYNTQITETGVIALIGEGDNCVALRADIDALPIFEETNLEFSSKNNGIMHACGHDMHTSMLLGVAEVLKSIESKLNGVVKLIFQPGEEKVPGGASIMIEAGVLENPKPKAIFGQHIFPATKTGTISINSGPFFASADELYWTITGKGGHAAQPHLSNDSILAAANLITFYQSMITKFRNPLNPGVLSITAINGGSATNIIPDEVTMMGTLRSFDEKWRFEMHELLVSKSQELAKLYNCHCELRIEKGYPALVNNSECSQFVLDTASQTLGYENSNIIEPVMFGEDFAFYAQKIPAAFWFLGVNPDLNNIMPPLHNSKLSPDEFAMKNGMKVMCNIAYNFLKNNGKIAQ